MTSVDTLHFTAVLSPLFSPLLFHRNSPNYNNLSAITWITGISIRIGEQEEQVSKLPMILPGIAATASLSRLAAPSRAGNYLNPT